MPLLLASGLLFNDQIGKTLSKMHMQTNKQQTSKQQNLDVEVCEKEGLNMSVFLCISVYSW